MNPSNQLNRRYYFFNKVNGEYQVELPETLEEYIQIESKIPPGTICIQACNGYYVGARMKVSIILWSRYVLPIPPEIKAYLLIQNICINE